MKATRALILVSCFVIASRARASGEQDRHADFDRVAGNVVSAINANDPTALARDFDERMRKALPPEEARRILGQISDQFGKVVDRLAPTWPGPDTATYPLTMEHGRLDLVVTLDANNLIAGVLFRPGSSSIEPGRFEEVAANLERAIRDLDANRFARDFSDATRKAITLDTIQRLLSGIAAQQGKLLTRGPASRPEPAMAIYSLQLEKGRLDLKIVLDNQGKIAGVWLLPPGAASVPAGPTRNSVVLSLPFRGRWLVLWGGPTAEQNAHHDVPNQRFALDLIAVDANGSGSSGNGSRNEDFFAYGREIFAPAPGTVTDVIDGVRDNRPGSMNPYSAVGNAVILRLADAEYAVLAHLKPASIRVKPGDRVAPGQLLGLCGNSGNSSQPHLHFHLQQTPALQDGIGIEAFFSFVEREKDGRWNAVADYAPVKGDVLRPSRRAPAS